MRSVVASRSKQVVVAKSQRILYSVIVRVRVVLKRTVVGK